MEHTISPIPHNYEHYHFAGFWRRTFALIIDYIVVSVATFPLLLILGLVVPDLVTVSVPFKLFTTTEVISEREQIDPNHITKDEIGKRTIQITQVTVLNHWKYHYKTQTTIARKGSSRMIRAEKFQINPYTENPVDNTSLDDLVIVVLLLYLTIIESSGWQASIGKKAVGLRVIDRNGQQLTLIQSLGRNLLKIVSGALLFIGFMMAGWTRRKQALHDKISNCYIIVD